MSKTVIESLVSKFQDAMAMIDSEALRLETSGDDLGRGDPGLTIGDYTLENVSSLDLDTDGELETDGDIVVSGFSLRGTDYDELTIVPTETMKSVLRTLNQATSLANGLIVELGGVESPEVLRPQVTKIEKWQAGMYQLTIAEARKLRQIKFHEQASGAKVTGINEYRRLLSDNRLLSTIREALNTANT